MADEKIKKLTGTTTEKSQNKKSQEIINRLILLKNNYAIPLLSELKKMGRLGFLNASLENLEFNPLYNLVILGKISSFNLVINWLVNPEDDTTATEMAQVRRKLKEVIRLQYSNFAPFQDCITYTYHKQSSGKLLKRLCELGEYSNLDLIRFSCTTQEVNKSEASLHEAKELKTALERSRPGAKKILSYKKELLPYSPNQSRNFFHHSPLRDKKPARLFNADWEKNINQMLTFLKKSQPSDHIKNSINLMSQLHQEINNEADRKVISKKYKKTISSILELCSTLINIFSEKAAMNDEFYDKLERISHCEIPKQDDEIAQTLFDIQTSLLAILWPSLEIQADATLTTMRPRG